MKGSEERARAGSASTQSAAGRPRRVLTALVLAITALCVGLLAWWAAPRSTTLRVSAPVICVYPRDGSFDRTAIVDCGGGGVQGVVHHAETLTPVARGRQDELPRKVPGATVDGELLIEKGWFSSYRYFFVAEDGTVTELFVTRQYIGGVEETL